MGRVVKEADLVLAFASVFVSCSLGFSLFGHRVLSLCSPPTPPRLFLSTVGRSRPPSLHRYMSPTYHSLILACALLCTPASSWPCTTRPPTPTKRKRMVAWSGEPV